MATCFTPTTLVLRTFALLSLAMFLDKADQQLLPAVACSGAWLASPKSSSPGAAVGLTYTATVSTSLPLHALLASTAACAQCVVTALSVPFTSTLSTPA